MQAASSQGFDDISAAVLHSCLWWADVLSWSRGIAYRDMATVSDHVPAKAAKAVKALNRMLHRLLIMQTTTVYAFEMLHGP